MNLSHGMSIYYILQSLILYHPFTASFKPSEIQLLFLIKYQELWIKKDLSVSDIMIIVDFNNHLKFKL